MIEKNALFYMANMYPEIGRMFRAHESGKKEIALQARNRALKIADEILAARDLKPAGREEWFVIKNMILGYNHLDEFEQSILKRYAEPFSYKFMNSSPL
ncbi:MAG: hypothetical protein HY228_02105 [Candidatus Yonathbacteria bacterium]|nr:hypothetical protein [Candidatus Yonathbacteria bacterium]